MKKRMSLNIILSIIVIILLIGSTYAWITWKGKSTSLRLTIGSVDTTRITFYPYIIEGEIVPVGDYSDGISFEVVVTNNKSVSTDIALYFDIKYIENVLKSEGLKYAVVQGKTVVSSGNFANATVDDRMYILETSITANTELTYSVYIYIDSASDTSGMTASQLSLELRGLIEQSSTGVNLIKNTYVTSKDTLYKVEHDAISASSSATGSEIASTTDYRYYGKNPNNYICLDFNNQTECPSGNLYRIIGVIYDELTGKERLKIIKDSALSGYDIDKSDFTTSFSWDSSASKTNSGYGLNDWIYADSNALMNKGYYNISTSYTCYTGQNNASISCNFSKGTYGLTTGAKSVLANARYYLGGYTTTATNTGAFYGKERGTLVSSQSSYYNSLPYTHDNIFGLMYPSDYGYASGSECTNVSLSAFTTACINKNWINNGTNQWTMTSKSSSGYQSFYINTSGKLAQTNDSTSYNIRPVAYIDGDIGISGGLGTQAHPYKMTTKKSSIEVSISEGLIPVVFDTSKGTVVKTISASDSDWYNYDEKKWANAVLVKDKGTNTRTYYQTHLNETINESDILAYFVWIPRYKYKIWTTTASSSGSEQEIEIVFESKDTEKSEGTAVDEYYTHPAFTFGNSELDGFWIGKFETTGPDTQPTVKPNLQSLRNQNISTQFATALNFAGGKQSGSTITFSGNSTYGLTSSFDSHMLNNNEWGAVAYLSRSKYGANREVYVNNSSGYYTGRSGGNVGGSTPINGTYTDQTATTQYNTYGFYTWDGYLLDYGANTQSSTRELNKVASTTGNIYGVYDMVGGAWEYIMGNFNSTAGNSGFSTFPNDKYINLYSSSIFTGTNSTNNSLCTLATCGGQALYETKGWYHDSSYFVISNTPWFRRGGSYNAGRGAGIFNSNSYSGTNNALYGFRVALAQVGT